MEFPVLMYGLMGLEHKIGAVPTFWLNLYLLIVVKAAAAIRTMLGCSVPSFGFCPCGACGGTEKYASLNGSSRTFLRSNLVS